MATTGRASSSRDIQIPGTTLTALPTAARMTGGLETMMDRAAAMPEPAWHGLGRRGEGGSAGRAIAARDLGLVLAWLPMTRTRTTTGSSIWARGARRHPVVRLAAARLAAARLAADKPAALGSMRVGVGAVGRACPRPVRWADSEETGGRAGLNQEPIRAG
jgi:hypothetical protein